MRKFIFIILICLMSLSVLADSFQYDTYMSVNQSHELVFTSTADIDSFLIVLEEAEQDYFSYVGGTGIKYIPVDEEVELNLG